MPYIDDNNCVAITIFFNICGYPIIGSFFFGLNFRNIPVIKTN